MKIVIIGGGFCGLYLAKNLQKNHEVHVLEKSRGVGGRLATRYATPFEFDHGAPYFKASSPEFIEFCNQLETAGVLEKWQNFYVGVPKMNAIGKFLSQGLNVINAEISTANFTDKWRLSSKNGEEFSGYDFLISTAPPIQTRNILPKNCHKNIENIEMQGCFSLMLHLETEPDFTILEVENSPIQKIVSVSQKPQRKILPSAVVYSTPKWAEENIENDPEINKNALLFECQKLGLNPINAVLHRWKYAFASPCKIFHILEKHYAISGDWLSSTNGVEGAFLSANSLLQAFKNATLKC